MEKFTKKKDEKLEKLKMCAEALLDPDKARLPEITRDYPRLPEALLDPDKARGSRGSAEIASDRPELSGGSAVGRCRRRRCGTTSSQMCSSCARSRGQSGAREGAEASPRPQALLSRRLRGAAPRPFSRPLSLSCALLTSPLDAPSLSPSPSPSLSLPLCLSPSSHIASTPALPRSSCRRF